MPSLAVVLRAFRSMTSKLNCNWLFGLNAVEAFFAEFADESGVAVQNAGFGRSLPSQHGRKVQWRELRRVTLLA
jgi:hypothetical protein